MQSRRKHRQKFREVEAQYRNKVVVLRNQRELDLRIRENPVILKGIPGRLWGKSDGCATGKNWKRKER